MQQVTFLHSKNGTSAICDVVAHFTGVKCECGIMNAGAFMMRLRREIDRACEFFSHSSETHMRNDTKILRIYGIIDIYGI